MRIAFSNLAAPAWTLERTVDAVSEYGYDGLELRLLERPPAESSASYGHDPELLLRQTNRSCCTRCISDLRQVEVELDRY